MPSPSNTTPPSPPGTTATADDSPLQNHLLAALPADVMQRWLPVLQSVDMPLGMVLYESGDTLDFMYFPCTAIVSMLYVMGNGESAEIAVVGNEGLVGLSLFMGGGSTPSRALVQNAGRGYRVPAAFAKQEFENCPAVMQLFLRFTQALIAQLTQTGACNKHHSLDQQLCRWLLLTLDRYQGNELSMTKQLIANMLGVSGDVMRAGAQKLQDEGLLHYAAGKITVRNRPGVEKRACECYGLVKKEYDRLLPQTIAT
jgi:CRP-like cAMP-binding protein